MKKTVLMILAAVMLMAGCGSASEAGGHTASPSAGAVSENETGAYTVNEDLKAAELPEDAQKAFDKAMEGFAGASYEPIILLGSQVVSGTNYAILCKSTVSYPDASAELSVVTVYEDLEGNASILSIVPFDLAQIAGKDHADGKDDEMTGAFETNTEYTAQEISAEAEDAFEKAFRDITGAEYRLAAELGRQVVSGTNYAFLALKTPAVQNPESKWAVVTVYQDLNGNVEILSIYELDPGTYTDYGQIAGSTASAETAQIAAPFHEVDSIEEAEKETGITIATPEALNDSDHRTIQVFDDGMIDIIYQNGESETARVRKMKGSDDISGDYNAYASGEEKDGKTYKGDGSTVSLVIWTADGCSYAVSFDGSVSKEEADQAVNEIA